MTVKENVLDPKVLEKQTTDLSEDQKEALKKEAIESRDKKPEKKDEKAPAKEDKEETLEEKEEKPEDAETPEQKAEKAKVELEKANKALLEKPDTELSETEKVKKAILVKDKAEAEFNLEAEAFAKEKNLPVEDAKKELTSYNKIAEKYKNNPKEMAKALLSSQREFAKLQDDHKKLKEAPKASDLKPGEAIINGKVIPAEEVREILIKGYKEENPEITEDMDDDKIYKLAVTRMKEKQASAREVAQKELSINAKDKRSKVLSGLSDSEKEYSEEITTLINDTPDHVIMHEDWNFDDVKAWARGRFYSPEKIEEIRKDGFKKGREEAEILGAKEKETPQASSGKAPKKGNSVAEQLTDAEKDRARDMYKTEGLTDEQKFEMFLDFKNYAKKK